MRFFAIAVMLAALTLAASPALAEEGKPDLVLERMGMKFIRGTTNVVTSVGELPKQTYLTIRDRGEIGIILGPLKGVGMTLYRAFIGGVETVGFLVPQPGYYDPMLSPEYVWQGWEGQKP